MSGEDKGHRGVPGLAKAKKRFLDQAMPCPLCKTPPEKLSWIYIMIPEWACKDTAEREGWVTICDRCKLQIDFFVDKN